MNKQDLKSKWAKYCDTDELVDDMCNLLGTYGHRYTESGVCKLLDTYFTNKEPLIKLFITSNHYIGDMRISSVKEFDRRVSSYEIASFFSSLHTKLHSEQLLKYEDGEGKTLTDYLLTGKKCIDIKNLPSATKQSEKLKKVSRFNSVNMATRESDEALDNFYEYMAHFRSVYTSTMQNDYKLPDTEKCPVIKKGTKTSRAFNAVCKYYGVNKLAPAEETVERDGQMVKRTVYPYDKVFAQYADLVSDLKRKLHFVISLNPLDYLTMSFGVNWNSCHNIRGGQYQGGCLSYLLDSTSIITYVVDNLDAPIHEIPKVYRQMYHYDNHLLVQNRLYPQGNDGAMDLYEKFRNFMIEEFTELISADGEWKCCVGAGHIGCLVTSEGTHYTDYYNHNSCSVFYPVEYEPTVGARRMTIGHNGICPHCGEAYTSSRNLSHSICDNDYFTF